MSFSEELAKLAELHQRGVLSDDEYARAKAKVLGAEGPAASAPFGGGSGAGLGAGVSSINAFRRSREDRWLGGVCGGLAQLTATPAWLWRLMVTLLVLCAGSGLLVYLLLWIFVPEED
ncbi:hypothetical protein DBR47_10285 [Paucibacter sp. KBW04]|uniref:PspC domain-containing protein n=1 Tax=Paucibacter sp. KBW04 TaxID=2153361 RepID=UPI000F56F1A0|nr:PspC domain-containing protein [Paucibacter sp. KBW04]RQO59764.1 hypothetical protein DBR47_10285 [Paucibacter sp. KBW04]